tara:strand:+ start:550 stop:750 length:201 start_codon:yes stop_codon:yes gene_type:complete
MIGHVKNIPRKIGQTVAYGYLGAVAGTMIGGPLTVAAGGTLAAPILGATAMMTAGFGIGGLYGAFK